MQEHRGEYSSLWAAVESIVPKIGCVPQTLLEWVKRAEFNIGTPSMHEGHQKEMMKMVEHGVIQGDKLNRDMMNMDMEDGKTMKHDDPNSVLLEPGQSKEVVWKFTEKADIEFACNVPGHYQSGMYGDVNFE